MINTAKEQAKGFLKACGFEVLSHSDSPTAPKYKNKPIAFVAFEKLSTLKKGYAISSSGTKYIFEVTLNCLLLGREGECSDRSEILSLAQQAVMRFNRNDYDAVIDDSFEIDGRLSRAKTVIKVSRIFLQDQGVQ
ncbi:MAG: hypothetical protein IJ555_00015 [Ruminococcus sp.]|nr:hypothetical protein [Ruminococcus sp.]MBR1750963.1 hypothetical protein [Ruminococcus sp.]